MSHVADGELHAYLDGALEFYPARHAKRIRDHLERCPECREQVEQEGRLVGSARTLLAEAAPGELAPPPLEELRRRADLIEVVEAKPARAPVYLRWAWAATVVLALGIGWGVGAWPGGGRRASVESAPLEPSPLESATPPAVNAEVVAVNAGPAAPASDAMASGNAARQESVSASPAMVAAAEPGAAPPSANVGVSASKAPVEANAAAERVVVDRVVDRRPAPQLSPEPLVPDGTGRLTGLRDAQTVAAAAPPPPADLGASAGRARRPEQAMAERPLVAQTRITVGPLPELRVPGGRPLAADTPPSRPGGLGQPVGEGVLSRAPVSPLPLPGLSVESIDWRDVGAAPALSIRARDGDGAEVELRLIGQWVADAQTGSSGRVDAAASGVAPAPVPENVAALVRNPTPGWEQVARAYRGGWVIAQGSLTQDRLRALLEAAGVP